MSLPSPVAQGSESRNVTDSLLPTHGTATTRANARIGSLESLRAMYEAADTKLLRLEEELDVLLHCAQLLRKQRTELTLGRLTEKDPSRGSKLEGSGQLIDDYLALAAKGEGVDKMIKPLKEECASARSDCNYLITKIRKVAPRPSGQSYRVEGRLKLHNEDTLPLGGPESGFADRDAVVERILAAESNAINVGAIVGAFGAGIAYTTLFSATRGRLDIISWAFACFLIVIISCASLQMFALPRHGQIARILRMEYVGSAEFRLLVFGVLVGLPMVAGFLLLAMSVAVLDNTSDSPEPGSQIAIRAAGYLPVASLGYFVIAGIITALIAGGLRLLSLFGFLELHAGDMPLEAQRYYPALFYTVKDKLHYLPGGDGYSLYRKRRLAKRN